ncbi:MAG: ComEC/Rec2 family competence protein [Planctomycetota bacterium]
MRRWIGSHLREAPLPCRPAVVAAAALAVGCVLGRLIVPWPAWSLATAWWITATALVAGWCVAACLRRSVAAALLLVAAVTAAGAAWATAQFDLFRRDELAWQLTETTIPVAIKATLVESFRRLPEPDDPRRAAASEAVSEAVVRVDAWRAGSRWRAASGTAILLVAGDTPAVGIGDRIRVYGRGLRPSGPLNPGEFDARGRARASRCLAVVRADAGGVRLLGAGSTSPLRWLDELRGRAMGVLEAHLSPSRVPLASALLLGRRESLPRADADDFLATGTVHILSISGLHVGLLALGLFWLVRLAAVPQGWALASVAVVTGCYMLLVRAETPVLRATLLVWLSCLAAAGGRRSPAINALAVAALVVLAIRPADVLSAGAQLSFVSTGVLIGLSRVLAASRRTDDPIARLIDRSRPAWERWLRRVAWHGFAAFATGGAIWLVTAPLVAARFHVVSPVGLVVNVLVAPLVALAMGWGCLCLAVAGLSTPLAAACGAACDASLAGIMAVVRLAAEVPGGHWWDPGPPEWWVAGWYALLLAAVLALRPETIRRPAAWATVVVAWCAVGIVGESARGALRPPAEPLRGVVAAMGHGCGIVFTTASGRTLVFDAGRLGAPAAAARSLSAVLWSEAKRSIDHLVVSHADADHFNAVPQLLERFAVREVVVARPLLASGAPSVRDLLAHIRAQGVPLRVVAAGDSFAVDSACRVRVLAPSSGATVESDNESSLVLAVEAAGRRWLLTGDLEGPALQRFVAADPDGCDVLVAPHHGSVTSLPPDVAAATRPTLVLVSGQEGRSWPLVRTAYADAAGGADVLATGRTGALAVDADAGSLFVTRFSGGRWRPVP